MLSKIKRSKLTNKDRDYLLINLITLACISLLVLLMDNLMPGVNIWGERKAKVEFSEEYINAVLASSFPEYSLATETKSCNLLVFSWQPVVTLPTTLSINQGTSLNPLIEKKYDVGASSAIWSGAKEKTSYTTSLYINRMLVSNEVQVTTPAC